MFNATPRSLDPQDGDLITILQEAECAPGTVRTLTEYLADTGIRSPDRPAHSESLHRLCYSGTHIWSGWLHMLIYTWWFGTRLSVWNNIYPSCLTLLKRKKINVYNMTYLVCKFNLHSVHSLYTSCTLRVFLHIVGSYDLYCVVEGNTLLWRHNMMYVPTRLSEELNDG